MPDIKEVYEMVVKQSPPQPGALDDSTRVSDAGAGERRSGRSPSPRRSAWGRSRSSWGRDQETTRRPQGPPKLQR